MGVFAGIVAEGLQERKKEAFHWVVTLGAPGLFAVSFLDASVIPLAIPGSTDLLLLWLISHGGDPWLLGPCALAGSLVGAWTTWRLGKKGGQKAIERYVPPRLEKRVCGWSQRNPVLTVFFRPSCRRPSRCGRFFLTAGALFRTYLCSRS